MIKKNLKRKQKREKQNTRRSFSSYNHQIELKLSNRRTESKSSTRIIITKNTGKKKKSHRTVRGTEEVDVGVTEGLAGERVGADPDGRDLAHLPEHRQQVRLGDVRVEIADVQRTLLHLTAFTQILSLSW